MSALRDALDDLPDPVFADLLESEDAYLLVVDLPGVTGETVDIEVEGGKLRLYARRDKRTPEGFRYRREDRPIVLDTVLPLPPDVTGEDVDGEIDRGVLEITLPKEDGEKTVIDIED